MLQDALGKQTDELLENQRFAIQVENIFTNSRRINEHLNTQINKTPTTTIRNKLDAHGLATLEIKLGTLPNHTTLIHQSAHH